MFRALCVLCCNNLGEHVSLKHCHHDDDDNNDDNNYNDDDYNNDDDSKNDDDNNQPSQNVSEDEVILRFSAVWLPCC